jgi:hypothetical protein
VRRQALHDLAEGTLMQTGLIGLGKLGGTVATRFRREMAPAQ